MRVWFKQRSEQGHLKEIGHPLENSGKVVRGKEKTVTGGPFAESKDVVGGFTLVEAHDLEQATALSKSCPTLEFGASVEVRPIQALNM